ncbi:hypothetical protein M2103_000049 [Ereboglobus sp. PH5-5]|uniref:calcineurin-like phosphoesterase C-terminal domain-containing protein n=1 Tax=unclassified Ereboglobus TaxID=2626932 RepID=UPI002405D938|nr:MULTISPECIES: calcineurin-like phosphoesterase C-terminal domain-containing protein [unclassified Ereboglobus]MDF9826798.1 hypothetical protein [Ereboglobus sp. PH5-10]MDF9831845.1 hypothetical protein [Ereboglobus sp. PH5-5]
MTTHHPTSITTMHRIARAIAAFLFLAVSGIAFAKGTHPDIKPDAGIDLYGSILDETGAPVAGVVVSDGFQCVATDARGVYQMKRNSKARMVYYSTPENFVVETGGAPGKNSLAKFWTKLGNGNRHNFDLARLPAPEREFTLVCVGDPQTRIDANLARYKEETIADLRAFGEASRLPCYAILLGDVVHDNLQFLEPMRDITSLAEIPFFAVIGNHDHNEAVKNDDYKSGENFENVFGPLNYSFNRGGVHIIGMDNILYGDRKNYKVGFTDEQVEWLRQNLRFVPKNKAIVLAYHAPLRADNSLQNREAVLSLLKGYADVQLMAGHMHTQENLVITQPIDAFEHTHATACGAWWRSTLNTDGTPNGFAFYTFNGNKAANWAYKSIRRGLDFQMRMYRGDARFGGPGGHFTYYQTADDIVVDVWNSDPSWKIIAYEDGVEAGPLKKLPRMVDAYAAGYHVGELKRKSYASGGNGENTHLYRHTLKNPNARVEVRATDRFGNTYSVKEFTTGLSAAKDYN